MNRRRFFARSLGAAASLIVAPALLRAKRVETFAPTLTYSEAVIEMQLGCFGNPNARLIQDYLDAVNIAAWRGDAPGTWLFVSWRGEMVFTELRGFWSNKFTFRRKESWDEKVLYPNGSIRTVRTHNRRNFNMLFKGMTEDWASTRCSVVSINALETAHQPAHLVDTKAA